MWKLKSIWFRNTYTLKVLVWFPVWSHSKLVKFRKRLSGGTVNSGNTLSSVMSYSPAPITSLVILHLTTHFPKPKVIRSLAVRRQEHDFSDYCIHVYLDIQDSVACGPWQVGSQFPVYYSCAREASLICNKISLVSLWSNHCIIRFSKEM